MKIGMGKRTLAASLATVALIGTNLQTTLAEDPQQKQQIKIIVLDDQQDAASEKEEKEVRVRVQVDKQEKENASKPWLGILLKAVEGDLARYLGSDVGILVDSVYDGSPAAKAGIHEGDVLLEANGQDIETPDVLLKILGDIDKGEKVELALLRRGQSLELSVEPAPRPNMQEIDLMVDVEGEELEIPGLEGMDESIRNALKTIRLRNKGEDLKLFSLGGPAFGWRDIGNAKNIDIEIVREIEGQEVEVAIVKKGGNPAEITVTRDGETKEYGEDDLKDMPPTVAELVKKHLPPVVEGQQVEVELIPKVQVFNLDENELAERAREMASKYREIRVKGRSGASEEVAKLKSVVEELKAEVAKLREELNDR